MRQKHKLFFLMTLLAVGQVSLAQTGVEAGSFTQWDVGARALGLSGAYTALADDSAAVYWNPAGVALIESPHAGLTIGYRPGRGTPFQCALVTSSWELRPLGTVFLGSGVVYRPVEGMGVDGDVVPQCRSLSLASLAINLSTYSRNFDVVSLGATLKRYSCFSGEVKGAGLGVDFGVIARRRFEWGTFLLGITYRDIGGARIDWRDAQGKVWDLVPWTNTWDFGLELADAKLRLVWGLRAVGGMRQSDRLHAGLEMDLTDELLLRLGLGYSVGSGFSVSAGVGVSSKNVRVDYAIVPHLTLGPIHVLSFELSWPSDEH